MICNSLSNEETIFQLIIKMKKFVLKCPAPDARYLFEENAPGVTNIGYYWNFMLDLGDHRKEHSLQQRSSNGYL